MCVFASVTVPVVHVVALVNEPTYLPCDITPSEEDDSVRLILWFRDDRDGSDSAIYRYVPMHHIHISMSINLFTCCQRHGVITNDERKRRKYNCRSGFRARRRVNLQRRCSAASGGKTTRRIESRAAAIFNRRYARSIFPR